MGFSNKLNRSKSLEEFTTLNYGGVEDNYDKNKNFNVIYIQMLYNKLYIQTHKILEYPSTLIDYQMKRTSSY